MRRALLGVAGCAVAVVLALAGGLLSGVVPVPGRSASPRPPCRDLPSEQQVVAALANHPETTRALTAAVPGARVSVSRPCGGEQADRALVRVSVPDGASRDAVGDWLGSHDGYGVPLEVETS